MENITEQIRQPFMPEAMLVAYRNGNGEYYLESRPIMPDGTAGAAKSVSLEFMRAVAKTFTESHDKTPHGRMPRRLLYADARSGSQTFVWWTPPGRRTLTFTDGAGLPDGDYLMPGTVYRVKDGVLYVYAFKGGRPSEKSRLLMGPFYNYYEDCRMCLGNSRIRIPDDPTWEDVLLAWEGAFWNSANAHLISHPVTGNIVTELRKAMTQPFDVSKCRPTKVTLGDILRNK